MSDRSVLGRPRWWQWATILSLDAPAVALAWQSLFARLAEIHLAWYHHYLLGVGVWMIYAADRWIEGWRLVSGQIQTQRHAFYHHWRWPVFGVWVLLLGANLWVGFTRLPQSEIVTSMVLALPVAAYLLSHQFLHRHHPWRAPKEMCVAVLFALGSAFFTARAPGSQLAWPPVLLFGGLCFANCILIAAWEKDVDRLHGQDSVVLTFHSARPLSRWLPWILAAAGIMLARETSEQLMRETFYLTSISAGLLGLLDLAEPWLGREAARVLADAALLTPLIVVWPA